MATFVRLMFRCAPDAASGKVSPPSPVLSQCAASVKASAAQSCACVLTGQPMDQLSSYCCFVQTRQQCRNKQMRRQLEVFSFGFLQNLVHRRAETREILNQNNRDLVRFS